MTRLAARTKGWLIPLLLVLLVPVPGQASVESEIQFHAGLAAFGTGDLEKARVSFERVVEEDPEDTAALRFLGLIARDQGRTSDSIALFQRALEVDPEDPDVAFDLGTSLLLAGRSQEAMVAFDTALEGSPDSPPVLLGAGIAAVRTGAARQGLEHLHLAMELGLDPALRDKARYYSGLAEIQLGDPTAAAGTFSEVETQSPQSPLARVARARREGLQASSPDRRWSASLTGGGEYDTNPTLVQKGGTQDDDGRFVTRLQGNYALVDGSRFSLTTGYDGYIGVHTEVHSVDLQTHTAFLQTTWEMDPLRFDLRYDFAYTWLDMDDPFRLLHRATASATLRAGAWGHVQFYTQLNEADFKSSGPRPDLDRDGTRFSGGINQWIYTPNAGPLSYLRVGVAGELYDTDGGTFSYDAVEYSLGFGLSLPWGVTCAGFYRNVWRYYDQSALSPDSERADRIFYFSLDLSKTLTDHWAISLGASATLNESDDAFFDYDRVVTGSYVSYNF